MLSGDQLGRYVEDIETHLRKRTETMYSAPAGGPPLSKTQTCKTFQLSHSLSSMGELDRSGLEFQEIANRLFVLIWRQVSTPQVVASASQESA